MRGTKAKQLRRVFNELYDLFVSQHLTPPITYRAFKRLWSRQVLPRA